MSWFSVDKGIESICLWGTNYPGKGDWMVTVREGDHLSVTLSEKKIVTGTVIALMDNFMILETDGAERKAAKILYKEIKYCTWPTSLPKPSMKERLENLTARLIKHSKIKEQKQLDAYIAGYLQGVTDQQNINWLRMDEESVTTIKNSFCLTLYKSFYFCLDETCGGYVVVMAENIENAIQKFRKVYQCGKGNTLRYRYIVNNETWQRKEHKRYAGKPVAILK